MSVVILVASSSMMVSACGSRLSRSEIAAGGTGAAAGTRTSTGSNSLAGGGASLGGTTGGTTGTTGTDGTTTGSDGTTTGSDGTTTGSDGTTTGSDGAVAADPSASAAGTDPGAGSNLATGGTQPGTTTGGTQPGTTTGGTQPGTTTGGTQPGTTTASTKPGTTTASTKPGTTTASTKPGTTTASTKPGTTTASTKPGTTTGGTQPGTTTGGTQPGTTTGGTGPGAAAAGFDPSAQPILGGNAACTPATGSQIQLGNVSTLSGVLGDLFSPVVPALQVFVKQENDCNGLAGHSINLVVNDDQDDGPTAVTQCQKEIQNNHIIAFLGDIQVLTIDSMKSCVDAAGIPMIGGDLTSNTWFTDQLIYPQGSPPQAISYGYVIAARDYFKKTKVGDEYCQEVPQACSQIDKAFGELAPQFGISVTNQTQISITLSSYTQQCLAAQSAGAQVLSLTVDAATQARFADSCAQANYHPNYIAYPLGVGNEKQFLGDTNLANTYVPLNTFAWMANSTPAEKYYQASVAKYNPGFTTGDAAGLGWTAGALMVAASTKLDPTAPTSQNFIDALQANFKGDAFSTLAGLTAPLTFTKGSNPKIPYCLFAAISNADNSGWATPVSKASCANVRAPSDPNQ